MSKVKILSFTFLLIGVFLANIAFPTVHSQEITRDPPEIGIFYYVWYNEDAQPWEPGITVDTPLFGNYDSNDTEVINQHLVLIENLGIDFVIISWWGNYDVYGQFTDSVAKQVFEEAIRMESNLKFAIMVEPFPFDSDEYNYEEIYNHVYDTFVIPYSSHYYNDSDTPLICFYNDEPGRVPNLTGNGFVPLDERFSTVTVGQQWYTWWIYTDLASSGATARVNQVSVTPRYDESRLSDRPKRLRVDTRLIQGTYDREWETAIRLWQEGKIDYVLITSWNEYFERTEIEPHFDATAANKNPYLLYQKTMDYISKFNNPFTLPTPEETPEPISSTAPTSTSTPASSSSQAPLEHKTEVIPEFSNALIVTFMLFILVSLACVKFRVRKK